MGEPVGWGTDNHRGYQHLPTTYLSGMILLGSEFLPHVVVMYWGYHGIYIYVNKHTLWLLNIAMENGSFIDGLPIKHCDFPWPC
jgi:hypothetical protein